MLWPDYVLFRTPIKKMKENWLLKTVFSNGKQYKRSSSFIEVKVKLKLQISKWHSKNGTVFASFWENLITPKRQSYKIIVTKHAAIFSKICNM